MKLQRLEDKFGHFLRYDPTIAKMKGYIMNLMQSQMEMNQLKPPKQVMVLEINRYYKAPGSSHGFNLAKINELA